MRYFYPIIAFLIFNFSFLIPLKTISQQTGMYFKLEGRKHVTLETAFLLYLPDGYDKKDRQWPLLLFLHGAKDDVVPCKESEKMVNKLEALGSPVKFTLYPDADHDAWTDAYNSPELWEWLAAQHKQ
jgi:dipeptidyl aminopeptidase/acylaminoacyl peptidase